MCGEPLGNKSILPLSTSQAITESRYAYGPRAELPSTIHSDQQAATTLHFSAESDEMQEIFVRILSDLESFLPYEAASVFCEDAGNLRLIAGRHHTAGLVGFTYPIADIPLYLEMAQTQKPIVLYNIHDEPRYRSFSDQRLTQGWMAVPIIVDGKVHGVITFNSERPGAFSEQDANLAQVFINQATISLINAQLLRLSRRAAEEQRIISQILHHLNATSRVSEILPATAEGLHLLTGCDAAELAIFEENGENVSILRRDFDQIGEIAYLQGNYAQSESAATPTILAGQIHLTEDLHNEEAFALEATYLAQGYRERCCWPLQLSQRVLGSIQLLWKSSSHRQIYNFEIFAQVVDAIAMAVEKNQLFTQIERRIAEKDNLSRFTLALRPLGSSAEIVQVALDHIRVAFRGTFVQLCRPASDSGYLEVIAEAGYPDPELSRRIYGEDSIFGYVFNTGQPYLSGIGLLESLTNPSPRNGVETNYQLVSALYAPIHKGTQIYGIVAVFCVGNQSQYNRDDLKLLTTMAEIIGTALHRSSLMETMEQGIRSRTQELAEANEQLTELDRLKSEFIANVSHELRTPLTNIRFYVDLLRRGRAERREQYLSILESETLRLHSLIESILDLSRINATREQGTIETIDFDIGLLLSEMHAYYLPLAVNKRISLVYQEPSSPLIISANRNQIIQVITNLLTNAINYTKSDGTVTLSVRSGENDNVEIAIQDTGIGISPDELNHLFERFYRSPQVTDLGILGTGLGLSIVKEIVELHKGTVQAESKHGEGSTFTVRLPVSLMNPDLPLASVSQNG